MSSSSVLHRLYALAFRLWRKERFAEFCRRLKPAPLDTLIDVGGNWWNWDLQKIRVAQILCVNPSKPQTLPPLESTTALSQVTGDGCALSYEDQSFSIAFSNSVIEHVGAFDRQTAFARELRRVGKQVWVQTPAYECPMEPHFLAIGVHWLPGAAERFAKRYLTPRSWLEGPRSPEIEELLRSTRLLTRREFAALFPDCEILTEKYFGFIPKSYIAVRTASQH